MEVVKVARAPLVACLTCPLCSSLLEEATTISECLHSFCRDCIHLKLSDDDAQSCPICDVYLGVAPLEKLRADPQLDEVRNKLFSPSSSAKRKAAGGSPRSPRIKRKERSLSSLGLLSAPSSSGRRKSSRAHYTRATRDITSSDEASEDVEESSESGGDHGKPSRDDKGKSVATGFQSPLAYLAELADSDAGRSGQPSSSGVVKDEHTPATGVKLRDASGRYSKQSGAGKSSRKRTANGETERPPQRKFQVGSSGGGSTSNGVWFALRPAENQDQEAPLPAISTPYLRITDGRLPVSLVKKYLATKLDLASETDVELTCRGQPIVSSLPLENVQTIWLAKPVQPDNDPGAGTASEDGPPSSPTNGAPTVQHFLMTLTYGRNRRTAAAVAAAAQATASAAT